MILQLVMLIRVALSDRVAPGRFYCPFARRGKEGEVRVINAVNPG